MPISFRFIEQLKNITVERENMFSQFFPTSSRGPCNLRLLHLRAEVDGDAMHSLTLLVKGKASRSPLKDIADQGLESVVADFFSDQTSHKCPARERCTGVAISSRGECRPHA